MRLFAAILLPAEVVADLEATVAAHRDDVLRWTAPESWHLTLAFYGQVSDARVPELKARLTRAARKHATMSLALSGVGRFDQRALWVGCQGDVSAMHALARSVAAAGRRTGAAAEEGRRFRAHVTLARAPRPVDLRPYVAALGPYHGRGWTADGVALVRSHLGAGENRRARYETLSTHPFTGRPA